MNMTGLYALFVTLCLLPGAVTQATTRYRNPWVDLVRQISCRGVTCNFQETCDLQVVCTPFGDCGQRATCLQIPFPRNTVCPDPFTNAGPPYTVECFDDAGCQEPMVCCHSYAKSYCHMPPFTTPGGAAANSGAAPTTNVVVEPVSESALMNQGSSGNPGNAANAANSNNGGSGVPPQNTARGGRSVVIARSDFFDPQGFRRQQRQNWQNSVDRRRRQQLNSLNSSVRTSGDGREANTVGGATAVIGDDGFRASLRRNINGGGLTLQISGQGEPGSRSFVDVNGIRITGDGVPGVTTRIRDEEPRNGDDRTRTNIRTRIRQDDRGAPGGVLRNDGRSRAPVSRVSQQLDTQPAIGSPGAPANSQGTQPSPGAAPRPSRIQGSRGVDNVGSVGGPAVRVNVQSDSEPRPFVRKVDLWRGHGFYGDRRRILGDVQLDGFNGFANRFQAGVRG